MTTGRIAAHRRFNSILQVALVCTPPPNTYYLGPTRVQIPNDISIGSAVFEQLMAEGHWRSVTLICGALEEHLLTYLLYCTTGRPSTLKIVPSRWGIRTQYCSF